jgi:hypothetical protein
MFSPWALLATTPIYLCIVYNFEDFSWMESEIEDLYTLSRADHPKEIQDDEKGVELHNSPKINDLEVV